MEPAECQRASGSERHLYRLYRYAGPRRHQDAEGGDHPGTANPEQILISMKESLNMKRVVDQLLRMVLVGLLLASANAFAGRGDKVGTGAAPELLIPVGARYVGMGNASASLSTGV